MHRARVALLGADMVAGAFLVRGQEAHHCPNCACVSTGADTNHERFGIVRTRLPHDANSGACAEAMLAMTRNEFEPRANFSASDSRAREERKHPSVSPSDVTARAQHSWARDAPALRHLDLGPPRLGNKPALRFSRLIIPGSHGLGQLSQ